jgi:hypothetical protein
MKAAIINPNSNTVVNVGVWGEGSTAPSGFTVVIVEDDFYVGPGFTYNGTAFIPPSETQSITE